VAGQAPGSNLPTGSVTFTVDGVPSGTVALSNGVASLTLPALPPGAHALAATYHGDAQFAASIGLATEFVTQPPDAQATTARTVIPNADVPAGTVLSAPANLVTVGMTTMKHHGKKFRHLVVSNTTGNFILGRLVFSGLSLKQFGQLFNLSKQQLQAVPTVNGSPAIDLFLSPNGQQTIDVPAGNGFTPLVIAGL
jgi:hypothetical protein